MALNTANARGSALLLSMPFRPWLSAPGTASTIGGRRSLARLAALEYDYTLVAQDASFALTAEAVTLDAAGNHTVSVQDASFALESEALTLLQDHLVGIVGADFAWESEAVTLTQDHLLAVQDAVLAWAAGAVTVSSSGGSGASAADIWNYEIAPGFTAERLLRIVAAAVAGKVSGAPANPVFRDVGDTQDMITGEADSSGNRASATYGP